MADIAAFLGSLVLVLVLAFLWEKLLFQRVLDDPIKGKVGSIVAGWLTASAIWFFATEGGAYGNSSFVFYLVAAVLLGVYAYHRGRRLREDVELGRTPAE